MEAALGIFEIRGWSAAMAALDAAEKAAPVRLVQLELNDLMGVVVKLTGSVGNVQSAAAAARAIAQMMHVDHAIDTIPAPDPRIDLLVNSPSELSPLIQQAVVFLPHTDRNGDVASFPADARDERKLATSPFRSEMQSEQEPSVAETNYAIGMIETQGFAAVIEAIDSACKAANVEIIGKEKTGGGYVTVVIKGDVGAVKAAIAAGKEKVSPLGKLVAAHVIPRPSTAVMSILPKG
jgi:microcompartment protein CcmL/EutN